MLFISGRRKQPSCDLPSSSSCVGQNTSNNPTRLHDMSWTPSTFYPHCGPSRRSEKQLREQRCRGCYFSPAMRPGHCTRLHVFGVDASQSVYILLKLLTIRPYMSLYRPRGCTLSKDLVLCKSSGWRSRNSDLTLFGLDPAAFLQMRIWDKTVCVNWLSATNSVCQILTDSWREGWRFRDLKAYLGQLADTCFTAGQEHKHGCLRSRVVSLSLCYCTPQSCVGILG